MNDFRMAPAALVVWIAAWGITGWPSLARLGLNVALWTVAGFAAATSIGWASIKWGQVASETGSTPTGRPRPDIHQVRGHYLRRPLRFVRLKSRRELAPRSRRRGGEVATAVSASALFAAGCVSAVFLAVQVRIDGSGMLQALAVDGAAVSITGRVASEPRAAYFGNGSVWTMSVETLAARAAVSRSAGQVQITSDLVPAYGSVVRVEGTLRPNDDDARAVAKLKADSLTPVRAPPAVLRLVNSMRSALMEVTAGLAPQAQGLVPGIAVGDTSRMPADLTAAFRTTGLTHLVAVSGGHFATVLVLVSALVGLMRGPRWMRALLVLALAAGFVALVRPEPSVVRAVAMAMVTVVGILLGRPAAAIPALSTAVVTLLVIDPWLAREFGFALSVAATAGLVLLTPPIMRRLTPWCGRGVAFALAVPIAAGVVCAPILVLLDPAVSTTSVLANLLAAPAVAPATLLGLGAAATGAWLVPVARALAWMASLPTWWIASVAKWCAALPGAQFPWMAGPAGAALLAGLTAFIGWAVLSRPVARGWRPEVFGWPARQVTSAITTFRGATVRLRRGVGTRRDWGLALGMVTLALVSGSGAIHAVVGSNLPAGEVPNDWLMVACDVGQGDGLVIRTGASSAVVVDVGPASAAMGRCLDRLGVERVDLVVLTHPHVDHIGGASAAFAGRTVGPVWVSSSAQLSSTQPTGAFPNLSEWVAPQAGDTIRFGADGWQTTVQVLQNGAMLDGISGVRTTTRTISLDSVVIPSATQRDEGDGVNDASLAIVAAVEAPTGSLSVVALGDLEVAGQQSLAAYLRRTGVIRGTDGVDVVKVAHHGSAAQSPRLARELSPKVALFSVGVDNTYGHPSASALRLYGELGAVIVRTDECGSAALVFRNGLAFVCF